MTSYIYAFWRLIQVKNFILVFFFHFFWTLLRSAFIFCFLVVFNIHDGGTSCSIASLIVNMLTSLLSCLPACWFCTILCLSVYFFAYSISVCFSLTPTQQYPSQRKGVHLPYLPLTNLLVVGVKFVTGAIFTTSSIVQRRYQCGREKNGNFVTALARPTGHLKK